MSEPRHSLHRTTTRWMSVVMIVIGVALLARTLAAGGGGLATGVILGVRADEEGTRAKERYFSPRDKHGDWDFRDQPPELWDQYKTTFPPGTHKLFVAGSTAM